MSFAAPETKYVNQHRVACDGGEGALGHPRVWLRIPEEQGWIECGYCDCKFVYRDGDESAAAGKPGSGASAVTGAET